ncbi:YIP1 family protein [Bacillus sonorensis]|uniref:Yip1 domain-containing protein n=2 Tax=Bacillus sonorensis TaxID=119858 RepID=M5P4Y6_9BACI|nr:MULTISPECIES: YIP1 family protein [Bacillus]TWK77888.1 Membrane protein YknW [Bacillus paralicheniformis]ASB89807.1 Membrane protein YknW [Bacillus sonorensis]EME74484.1 hypothetical protein BSONL12_11861 [Bacillus sonorensis L12]MCF7619060.1 YIP1 family protein [Bacillus sonorensis]MCY7855424.1 YIP1 family protein [Bacillus sonorensis]
MEADMTTGNEKKPSLFGLITSPVRQFERMGKRPAIWLPMVIVLALSAASTYLNVATFYSSVQRFEITAYFQSLSILLDILKTGIFFFLSALIFWLIASIGGGKTNFLSMLSLSIFISFIATSGHVINNLVYYVSEGKHEAPVTSLQGIISIGEPFQSMLGVFDIFTVWPLILIGVGLQHAGGASKRASWIGVAVLFALIFLVASLFGLAKAFFSATF